MLLLIVAGNVTFIGLLRFVMSPNMVRRRVLDFTGSATFSGVSSSSVAALPGTNSGAYEDKAPKPVAPPKGVIEAMCLLEGDIPKLLHKLRLLASPVRRFKLSHTEARVLPDDPRRIKFRQSSSATASGDVAAHAAAQAALVWAAMAACIDMISAALGEQDGMSQAPGGKKGDAPTPWA